jgi:hypothetical protein
MRQEAPLTTQFFSIPKRGGWFAVLNCTFWVFFMLVAPTSQGVGGLLLGLAAIIFAMPLAIPILLYPTDSVPTLMNIVTTAALIGANSLVWGYGISFFIRKINSHRRNAAR